MTPVYSNNCPRIDSNQYFACPECRFPRPTMDNHPTMMMCLSCYHEAPNMLCWTVDRRPCLVSPPNAPYRCATCHFSRAHIGGAQDHTGFCAYCGYTRPIQYASGQPVDTRPWVDRVPPVTPLGEWGCARCGTYRYMATRYRPERDKLQRFGTTHGELDTQKKFCWKLGCLRRTHNRFREYAAEH